MPTLDTIAVAVQLTESGDHAQAFSLLRAALGRDPQSVAGYMALGELLYRTKDYLASAGCYHKVLELDPNFTEARVRLGNVCGAAGDVTTAINHMKQVLPIWPSVAHHNLSRLYLYDKGDFDLALKHVQAALSYSPDDPELICRRAQALLALGRFKQGWVDYEQRHRVPFAVTQGGVWQQRGGAASVEFFGLHNKQVWSGQPVDHLLVHHEQGFGDTLQWSRYIPLIAKRCQQVSVVVPPSLLTLMQDAFADISNVTIMTTKPETFEVFVFLDSLPHLFDARIGNIPDAPYLRVKDLSSPVIRDPSSDRPLIGLAWAGRPGLPADRWRSMPFATIAPLLDLNAQFVSLQKDQPIEDPRLLDMSDRMVDWYATACLIAKLDLVISVDTAIVHLAGALGKPVWLLNRHNTCWRWLTKRTDSPWYPTMHIYRQREVGDWSPVIAKVRKDLSRGLFRQ